MISYHYIIQVDKVYNNEQNLHIQEEKYTVYYWEKEPDPELVYAQKTKQGHFYL